MKCLNYGCSETITHTAYCAKCVNKMDEELKIAQAKLQETHTCCINYANKLNIAGDKLRRRNMQIKDLKTLNAKLLEWKSHTCILAKCNKRQEMRIV